MKQIKGEPWPPGETLAGHRDGIQMEDHGRGIQEVWGLCCSFSLVLSLCFFWPILIALCKVPQKEQHLWDIPCL